MVDLPAGGGRQGPRHEGPDAGQGSARAQGSICAGERNEAVVDLLTTKQLQELLQVDRITIYRMLEDGRLPGFKVGGQWRFSRQEIDAWLLEQRSHSEATGAVSTVDHPADYDQALPVSCVQIIQGIYAEALDVAMVTTDLEGSPLTAISNSCDFCHLILSTEEGRRRCSATWRHFEDGQVRHCHANLLCVAKPIDLQGEHVAVAAACQFVAGGEWRPGVERLASDLDIPAEKLQLAAASVRVVPGEDLPRLAGLLGRVAEALAQIAQERLNLVSRLQHIAQMSKI